MMEDTSESPTTNESNMKNKNETDSDTQNQDDTNSTTTITEPKITTTDPMTTNTNQQDSKSNTNNTVVSVSDETPKTKSTTNPSSSSSQSLSIITPRNFTTPNAFILESTWESVNNDSNELESLLFSLRRPTSRHRLQTLVTGLKQLAAKLQRHEEVEFGLLQSKIASSSSQKQQLQLQQEQEQPIVQNNTVLDDSHHSTQFKKRSFENELNRRENHDNNGEHLDESYPLQPNTKKMKIESSSPTLLTSSLNSTTTPTTASLAATNTNSTTSTTTTTTTSTTNPLQQLIPPTKQLSAPPILKTKDKWVHHHQESLVEKCPDYQGSVGICPLGNACPRLHIYSPMGLFEYNSSDATNTNINNDKTPTTTTDSNKEDSKPMNQFHLSQQQYTYTREDLEKAYETYRQTAISPKLNYADKIKPDELNVAWYSSRFHCPIDNVFYYSFPLQHHFVKQSKWYCVCKSSQNIWWFNSSKEARDALASHVIYHLQSCGIVPTTFLPMAVVSENSATTTTTTTTNNNNTSTTTTNGSGSGTNNKQKNIKRTEHILRSFSSISYETPLKTITKQNVHLNNSSAQPPLPNIIPWNWMEVDYNQRCSFFNSTSGCQFGNSCHNAHVHFPSSITTNRFPNQLALKNAYWDNFQYTLHDPFFSSSSSAGNSSNFHIRSNIDGWNTIWYTAAWRCPVEGTIYYAAGGTTGKVNGQNMFLYPTAEDAKLAVCGVVLNAFMDRGMQGNWDVVNVAPVPPPPPLRSSPASTMMVSSNSNSVGVNPVYMTQSNNGYNGNSTMLINGNTMMANGYNTNPMIQTQNGFNGNNTLPVNSLNGNITYQNVTPRNMTWTNNTSAPAAPPPPPPPPPNQSYLGNHFLH